MRELEILDENRKVADEASIKIYPVNLCAQTTRRFSVFSDNLIIQTFIKHTGGEKKKLSFHLSALPHS